VPVHRFQNATDAPLLVWVEPWCEEIEVPPGSTLIITAELHPGCGDETLIDVRDDRIVYWCTGPMYTAELDGKLLA
jgi:hypothetical protein